jgi:hypothetical protein
MKYLTGQKRIKNDKDYFEVEKIITRKVDGKNKLYLVKWVGYPLADCSWEPISHLQKILDMVVAFDQNFPASIDKKRLRKYLYVSHLISKRRSHIIKIKNPFLKKRELKNKKISENDNIIICIDNSSYLNKKDEEKKEEEKENEEENKETEISIDNINIKEEKQQIKTDENLNEINMINSDENNFPKLIRPIIVW